jgi:hypothetical protein
MVQKLLNMGDIYRPTIENMIDSVTFTKNTGLKNTDNNGVRFGPT